MKRSADSTRLQRGFTLLEMLVVLILTGMIVGILMQGLQQALRLQTHFGREIFDTQQGEMYVGWFRQSVNGMMPDYAGGKNVFKGSQREFSGLTLSPLDAASAALLPFSWYLSFDADTGQTRLLYGNKENPPSVLAWTGNSGKFVYFDAKGEAHESWPPFLGRWPQLPAAIHLEYQRLDGPRVVVAAPMGPDIPLPREQALVP